MIFPGFPGILSFFQVFQVFQVEWEPWGILNSLHLLFFNITFIIFENTNTDVYDKCEWAFTQVKQGVVKRW